MTRGHMGNGHHHAAGATGAGRVVLELGGDVGVLVLHTPAALLGHEIEISPVSDNSKEGGSSEGARTHSMVRERVTAAGVSYAAVYPGVPAGLYVVWRDAGTQAGPVAVSGGQVARFTLAG